MARSSLPRRGLVALVLAVVVLLGACTHQRPVPDKYGETTEENFLEGCVDTLTQNGPSSEGASEEDLGESEPFASDRARNVCVCAYDGISGEGGIPFDRFKEITSELEDEPGPLPDEILTIVEGCVADNPA